MSRAPAKDVATTRRLFLATLGVLVVVALIGVATWPDEPWRTIVVVVGFTTYLFTALSGVMLASQRWPGLDDFLHLHSWAVIVVVMGSAAAVMGYLAYPDPVMLLIGPFVLGFYMLVGWAVEKVHPFGL